MMNNTKTNMIKSIKTIGSISVLIMSLNSQASDLTIPNQFTSGARAVAADVNANFDAAATSVTDNQTQITDLIAQITALTATVNANSETITANSATIASLETENTNLQAEVDALQTDSVTGLSSVLTVGTDNQGNTAAIFSGVNLHINNGTGDRAQINGLGNFIVGYDEVNTSTVEICSDGLYTDQVVCENTSNIWSNSHKSGSHNLIIGARHNYSSYGAFIAGRGNSVNRSESSVLGGIGNLVSGLFSSVSGGAANIASGQQSSVSGGQSNISSGGSSSVSGGDNNSALGVFSSVSGGDSNTASGTRSTVSGGSSGEAPGNANWVAGTLFEDN